MNFPKQVMKSSELQRMGFSSDYLMELAGHPAQNFCWRMNPNAKNSPLLFDTDRLQKWIDREIKFTKV